MEAGHAGCRAVSHLFSRSRTDRARQCVSLQQLKTQHWATTDDQRRSAAAKDLTADLKLTRYPRSLAATLAAFPSVSLFPQLGSLITRISIGRNASTASCTACPPWREVLWECEASSHRFLINGLFLQKRREDARTRRAGSAHSKSPADCGTKHNGRKFAQAAKTFIDSGTDNTDRRARLASATEDATLHTLLRLAPLAGRGLR